MGVSIPHGTRKAELEEMLREHVEALNNRIEASSSSSSTAKSHNYSHKTSSSSEETFTEKRDRESKEERERELKCTPEVRTAHNLFEWGAFWGIPIETVRVLRGAIATPHEQSIDVIRRTFPNLTPKKTVYEQIARAFDNEKRMREYEREYKERWVHHKFIPTEKLDLFWRLYKLPPKEERSILSVLDVRTVTDLLAREAEIENIYFNEMRLGRKIGGVEKKTKVPVEPPKPTTGISARTWMDLEDAIKAERFFLQVLDDRLRICVTSSTR